MIVSVGPFRRAIRVPEGAAVIIPAEKSEELPAAVATKTRGGSRTVAATLAKAHGQEGGNAAEAEKVSAWTIFSPAVLTAKRSANISARGTAS